MPDIHKNIADEKYKNTAPFELFSVDKDKYSAYMQEEARMCDLFDSDVAEELGIVDNPKKDKMLAKAWEMGHSSGYGEVYNYCLDLVELIEEDK